MPFPVPLIPEISLCGLAYKSQQFTGKSRKVGIPEYGFAMGRSKSWQQHIKRTKRLAAIVALAVTGLFLAVATNSVIEFSHPRGAITEKSRVANEGVERIFAWKEHSISVACSVIVASLIKVKHAGDEIEIRKVVFPYWWNGDHRLPQHGIEFPSRWKRRFHFLHVFSSYLTTYNRQGIDARIPSCFYGNYFFFEPIGHDTVRSSSSDVLKVDLYIAGVESLVHVARKWLEHYRWAGVYNQRSMLLIVAFLHNPSLHDIDTKHAGGN